MQQCTPRRWASEALKHVAVEVLLKYYCNSYKMFVYLLALRYVCRLGVMSTIWLDVMSPIPHATAYRI
jgi:hypothetical protein